MLLCNTSTISNQFHYMQVKTRYTADRFPTTADQLGFITRTHIIQHVQDLVFPAHSTVPQHRCTPQSADTTWMQTVTCDPSIHHDLKPQEIKLLQWTLAIACPDGLCTLTFGLFLRANLRSSALTFSLRSVITPI